MFMALRQEDRHPITDILDRTPPIPENCQWALFLRNHDELTLEMVTDAERDYMYNEYAKDSRMRLNLGIRRRLAPLIDNSRRRTELLNSLLFSMPGSPIIYYGDELGMGDNFFLGDRDGVRTPMQWNMDRNGGFSGADAARLYLPVIMDPVYGYQSVNVEAQERNPSSMLHFMRRMIALRRQHKAFGRGTMDFLRPDNRAILAYLRRYLGEIILIVANLSRFVQPAELDLSEFRGRIPVEMIGRNEFPPIGDLPYFMTLGPHSFYWFRLEPPAEPIKTSRAKNSGLPPLPQISLDESWDTLLKPEYLFALCNDILPPFLAKQRWFRGKGKDISSCHPVDWCKISTSFYIIFLQVRYITGEQETYVMPLKIVYGTPVRTLIAEIPGSIIASVKSRKGEGILYDGLVDRSSCDILFAAIGDGRRYETSRGGLFRALPTGAYEELINTADRCSAVKQLGAEQSNTSIIIGESYVLKLYRRLEGGLNPDVEISLFLTEKSRYTGIARVAGTISYTDASGQESTVGMLQEFIANEGDGWLYTLSALQEYLAKAEAKLAEGKQPPTVLPPIITASRREPPASFSAITRSYLQSIRTLGQRTANFHLALAQEKKNPDFKPVNATRMFTEHLAESIAGEIQDSLALLSGRMKDFPAAARKKADRVLVEGPSLLSRIGNLAEVGENLGQLIRHHGDFHLGQILLTADHNFILLDFEGEPLRPLSERRSKGSALKDVAGMIRSFHYAAHTALISAADDGKKRRQLAPWSQAWYAWVSAIFAKAYFDAAAGAAFLPTTDADFILEAFLLEKVFYELKYELNNRPEWVGIPLAGIIDIIDKQKFNR
jgi:maltose alpha-D-glucosyltransferase/alpha-amylase